MHMPFLPLLQPGAYSHTHQEAATKPCSLIRGRDGTDLTFLQMLELRTKPAPPHEDAFISSGLFKEQVPELCQGSALKSKCQQGVSHSTGVHKSRSWMDSLKKMVQLPLNILLSALKKIYFSSLSLKFVFFSFSFIKLDYESTRIPKCSSFLGEIRNVHPK